MKIFIPLFLLIFCLGCAGVNFNASHDRPFVPAIPSAYSPKNLTQAAPVLTSGGIGTYFNDRLNDFVDIFSLSMSIGFGAQANVRATQAIQAGGLFWGGSRFGFIGREGGAWSETVTEFGFPGMYIRSVQIVPGGGNIQKVNTERGQFIWQFLGDKDIPYDTGYDRKFWQVGATAHAIIAGLDFSINLKELLDFILGLVTLDISSDDTASLARQRAAERLRDE